MNNEQFRNLVRTNNSAKSSGSKNEESSQAVNHDSASSLGSRQRASIPMTPYVIFRELRVPNADFFLARRAVRGAQSDFARQLAERNKTTQPQRKFKTSAPKGVKLASGYLDRTQRQEEASEDDREERLKALEKCLKDEEIDQATYEKLRSQIAGGDLGSTHLVKGLDFKLLERIRRGDDVYGEEEKKEDAAQEPEPEPEQDVDAEFDELEEQEVHATEKVTAEKKKGQLSTVALAPGKKRTRDQILAELKAARLAAKAQQEPNLGDRFRKIGAKQMPGRRIERDSKGREVLIIIDADGHEKRKIRRIQPGEDEGNNLPMPDIDAKPLGMEVPEQYKKKAEPEEDDGDVDIFEGVSDDYDPLAGMNDSDSDSDSEEKEQEHTLDQVGDTEDQKAGDHVKDGDEDATISSMMPPPPKPPASVSRNYFKDSKSGLISEEVVKGPSMSDPAIMAAFKKAASLRPIEQEQDKEAAEAAKALDERRKKLLQSNDRDDEDLDMGFGTSRFEDEEDFEDKKVKLSVWGGDKDDGEGAASKGGSSKRKRGAKKRRGDGNNAADVLRVMEQRKKS